MKIIFVTNRARTPSAMIRQHPRWTEKVIARSRKHRKVLVSSYHIEWF